MSLLLWLLVETVGAVVGVVTPAVAAAVAPVVAAAAVVPVVAAAAAAGRATATGATGAATAAEAGAPGRLPATAGRQLVPPTISHPCVGSPTVLRRTCPCRLRWLLVAAAPADAPPPDASWSITLSPVRRDDGESPAEFEARAAALRRYNLRGVVLGKRVPPFAAGATPPGFAPIPPGAVNWTANSAGGTGGGSAETIVSTPGETEVVFAVEEEGGRGTAAPPTCAATLFVRLLSLPPTCPVRCIEESGDCGGIKVGGLVWQALSVVSPGRRAAAVGSRRAVTATLPLVAARGANAASAVARRRPTQPRSTLLAPVSRVVGGRPVAPAEQQRLVYMVGADGSMCSGSVISPTHVLTAAHCVVAVDSTVYVGGSGGSAATLGTPHTVARFVPHPRFATDEVLHDVAVVELDSPVRPPAGGELPVMGLPRPGTAPRVDSYARVAGYGEVDAGIDMEPVDATLLAVDIRVLAKSVCLAAYRRAAAGAPLTGLSAQIGDPVLVCAGYLDGGCDTCAGDSGGPLYQTATQVVRGSTAVLTTFVQVGVTAFGEGCANVDQPGVYTLVAPHTLWIEGVMAGGDGAINDITDDGEEGEGEEEQVGGGDAGDGGEGEAEEEGGATPARPDGPGPVGTPSDGGGADAAIPPADGDAPTPDGGGIDGRDTPDAGGGGVDPSGDGDSSSGSSGGSGVAEWWVIALGSGSAILGVTGVVVGFALLRKRRQAAANDVQQPNDGDP